MNCKINIKVGDFIFNKGDVVKGNSTILYRVDNVEERELKKLNYTTGTYEPYVKEILVGAYCLATGHGYNISVRADKDEWGVISAETMKVLCA